MRRSARAVMGITKIGIGAGAGGMALGAIGGTSAANAATGLGNMAGALPAAGTIGGAGMVLGQMKGLQRMMRRK